MRRYGTFFNFNKPGQQVARYFGTNMLFGSSEANIYLYKFFHDKGSSNPMESALQYHARCFSEFKSCVEQHQGCYTVLATSTYAGWEETDPARAEYRHAAQNMKP